MSQVPLLEASASDEEMKLEDDTGPVFSLFKIRIPRRKQLRILTTGFSSSHSILFTQFSCFSQLHPSDSLARHTDMR